MNGYEFESHIATLLTNMGFIVESTPLSGDGGIDLIATLKKPVFKSTYLIQCKYWSSPVGEPTVRDLYGVVLAKNANKGIVITNSTFTDKAIEFADNKNIELIDGPALNTLLETYGSNMELDVTYVKSFKDFEEFERDKYNYLINRIERDKGNKSSYETLLNFYINHIHLSKIKILEAGLLVEVINFIQDYIKRFCKRTKTLLNEKKALQLILSQLYILKNELPSALELLQELGLFHEKPKAYTIGAISNLLPEYYTTEYPNNNFLLDEIIKIAKNKSFNTLILLNLYQIFNEINYKNGIVFLENTFDTYKNSTLNMLQYGIDRHNLISANLAKYEALLEQLREKVPNEFYLPTSYTYDSQKWNVFTKENSISSSLVLKEIIDKKKIASQIGAMDLILSTT